MIGGRVALSQPMIRVSRDSPKPTKGRIGAAKTAVMSSNSRTKLQSSDLNTALPLRDVCHQRGARRVVAGIVSRVVHVPGPCPRSKSHEAPAGLVCGPG